jgi:hypothetical protein
VVVWTLLAVSADRRWRLGVGPIADFEARLSGQQPSAFNRRRASWLAVTERLENAIRLCPHLDEHGRRSFAAREAWSAGYGGIAAVGEQQLTDERGIAISVHHLSPIPPRTDKA